MTESVADDIAELALRLHEAPDVEESIDMVLEFALTAVGCSHAGVLLVDTKGAIENSAVTDPVVAEVDRLQLDVGEGPGLSAIRNDAALVVSDIGTDPRWLSWRSRAAELGLRSALSVPVRTISSVLGSLNLYDREPDHFSIEDRAVAHVLARHAAIALAGTRQEEQLWRAIDARKRIGLAMGILMERYELNEDQAFAVLRRYSQDNNVKLNDVAARLVATRRLTAGRSSTADGVERPHVPT